MELAPFIYGTSASVVKNRTILMNKDIVHEVGCTIEFLDPAFELWFKNYFLNIPINPLLVKASRYLYSCVHKPSAF